ncbi:MAG: DUF86 domain-containing protein [Anaerolineae bacterium]|nr:DUF86 domain-containing protein [Anaerolineae bacterium]
MRRDDAYLLDMLIAAQRAARFVADLTWEDFAESDLHQSAVIRELEVLGEAAHLVSEDTRAAHPELPWPQIIGMRNRLIHEYFRVDLERVWETVERDIPELIRQLRPLIPAEDDV